MKSVILVYTLIVFFLNLSFAQAQIDISKLVRPENMLFSFKQENSTTSEVKSTFEGEDHGVRKCVFTYSKGNFQPEKTWNRMKCILTFDNCSYQMVMKFPVGSYFRTVFTSETKWEMEKFSSSVLAYRLEANGTVLSKPVSGQFECVSGLNSAYFDLKNISYAFGANAEVTESGWGEIATTDSLKTSEEIEKNILDIKAAEWDKWRATHSVSWDFSKYLKK